MEGRALNLAIGIDISRSMLAEDVAAQPAPARRSARRAGWCRMRGATGLRCSRSPGRSYILTPLTLDDGAVSLQLDALDPDVASEGGPISPRCSTRGASCSPPLPKGGARALVLFTDGETHGPLDEAVAAARALRSAGITLVLVAEGDSTCRPGFRFAMSGARSPATRPTPRAGRCAPRGATTCCAPSPMPPAASWWPPTPPIRQGAVRRVLAGLERERHPGAAPRRSDPARPGGLRSRRSAAGRAGAAPARVPRSPAAARCGARPGPRWPSVPRRETGCSAGAIPRRAAAAFPRGGGPPPGARHRALQRRHRRAVARGEFAAARQWLTQASRSLDPDLRFRALYNLGLVALLESRARHRQARRAGEEAAASSSGRRCCWRRGSREAKWNLELVQQRTAAARAAVAEAPPPPTPPRQAPPTPSPTGSGAHLAGGGGADPQLGRAHRARRARRAGPPPPSGAELRGQGLVMLAAAGRCSCSRLRCST